MRLSTAIALPHDHTASRNKRQLTPLLKALRKVSGPEEVDVVRLTPKDLQSRQCAIAVSGVHLSVAGCRGVRASVGQRC